MNGATRWQGSPVIMGCVVATAALASGWPVGRVYICCHVHRNHYCWQSAAAIDPIFRHVIAEMSIREALE